MRNDIIDRVKGYLARRSRAFIPQLYVIPTEGEATRLTKVPKVCRAGVEGDLSKQATAYPSAIYERHSALNQIVTHIKRSLHSAVENLSILLDLLAAAPVGMTRETIKKTAAGAAVIT